MRSYTSSSERLTAADRPGVAQPVPVRDVPDRPWAPIALAALVIAVAAFAAWEWRVRSLMVLPGALEDGESSWAEQRRRIDAGDVAIAIVGDSRILFDTDLDRFEAMTGVRPVQLALPGTNARPFLEDLAADADFDGVAIVGIAEMSYYRERIGLMAGALERYRYESPSQRIGYLIERELSRRFGFLDRDYRLSKLVLRTDPNVRPGVRGPYDDVWKVATYGDGRQTRLWRRLETDARLRDHARFAWHGFTGDPVPEPLVASTIDKTRAAVAAIRARGGEVVFVRPPSEPVVRANEEARLTRARGRDALLATADVRGFHADDDPALQGIDLPEYSHLSAACATVYTDRYVRALARLTPRIAVRADAPGAMTAADCARADTIGAASR
jgi:hypothetical protein